MFVYVRVLVRVFVNVIMFANVRLENWAFANVFVVSFLCMYQSLLSFGSVCQCLICVFVRSSRFFWVVTPADTLSLMPRNKASQNGLIRYQPTNQPTLSRQTLSSPSSSLSPPEIFIKMKNI